MNEKEFNLQILAKLVEIANVVFSKFTLSKEGTFIAAELWKGKNALNESIYTVYNDTIKDEYTVEVGTYKLRFPPERAFYLVMKFEQLCKVRQENKARFTYGVEKREIITGKAMYIGKGEKVMKRKKTLVKLSEHVAYEPCKQSDSVDMYYFAGGIWYYVQRAYNESQLDRMATKLENDTEWLKNTLNGMDYTQDIAINTIYKALYDVLCTEAIKDTPNERKCENKPENTSIHEDKQDKRKQYLVKWAVTGKKNYGSLCVEQIEVRKIGDGLYKDMDNDCLCFEHDGYLYTLGRYGRGVASFLKEQTDIKAKIVSMIEAGGVSTESAKILYEKITGHTLGAFGKVGPTQEKTHEDYPPEPYNRTGKTSCNDETVSKPERKVIRTTFARQKVFSNELYSARRKISRFKRLSRLRYTNYHSRGESAANRTGSGKSGGYSVVAIRGSAKRKGKINSLSP